jgi:hypothetical protein
MNAGMRLSEVASVLSRGPPPDLLTGWRGMSCPHDDEPIRNATRAQGVFSDLVTDLSLGAPDSRSFGKTLDRVRSGCRSR